MRRRGGSWGGSSTCCVEVLELRVLPSIFPHVVSIEPQSIQFTNLAKFTVVFSGNVTGVDGSDFVAVKSGVQIANPLQVTGSGSVYTVTASGLTGNGTLGINLVDNGSIRDAGGHTLIASNALFTFGAAQNFAVGNSPSSVAIGNLNGDGQPDLVVANKQSNTVSFLLGSGQGLFGPATNYATENAPNSVTLLDMNGDRALDAVVANQGSNSVSVLFGTGRGTSTTTRTFASGTGPSSVAVGDINGDGRADLLLDSFDPLSGFNVVTSLLGNGDGTFRIGQQFLTSGQPAAVALHDLNHDGRLDLVIAHGNASNTVSIMPGNGNGTFSPPTDYATGNNPSSLAFGDLNGDGNLDLVTSNSSSNSLSVLFGNPDGTFSDFHTLSVAAAPVSVAVGDVNGDGRADLAVVYGGMNVVSVQLSTSNGSFAGQTAIVSANIIGVATAPNVVSANSAIFTFTVQYSSLSAIDVARIDPGNVTITGPNGFNVNPLFASVDVNSNGTPRTATYTLIVPNGSWQPADNGLYTISAGPLAVRDIKGHAVSGTMGTFFVDLPYIPPPGTENLRLLMAGGNFELVDSDHGDRLLGSQPASLELTIDSRAGVNTTLRIDRSVINNPGAGKVIFNGGSGGQNTLVLDSTNTQTTQSPADLSAADGQFTFNNRQIVSYGNIQMVIPIERMYRAYNPAANVHIFTNSPTEFAIITANGLHDETTGQPGWAVASNQVADASGVFRLYNPNTGEHYYTLSIGERNSLVISGWNAEGIDGYLFSQKVAGSTPIFRLYNQVGGEHLYTESVSYRDAVLAAFPGIWVSTNNLGFGFAVDGDEINATFSIASLTAHLSASPASSRILSDAAGVQTIDSTNAPVSSHPAPANLAIAATPSQSRLANPETGQTEARDVAGRAQDPASSFSGNSVVPDGKGNHAFGAASIPTIVVPFCAGSPALEAAPHQIDIAMEYSARSP